MHKYKLGDRVVWRAENSKVDNLGIITGISSLIDDDTSYYIKAVDTIHIVKEINISNTKNKGGKRVGSGRKPSVEPTRAIRLSVSLIERLDYLKSLDVAYKTFKILYGDSNSPRAHFFRRFIEAVDGSIADSVVSENSSLGNNHATDCVDLA